MLVYIKIDMIYPIFLHLPWTNFLDDQLHNAVVECAFANHFDRRDPDTFFKDAGGRWADRAWDRSADVGMMSEASGEKLQYAFVENGGDYRDVR